MKVVKELDKLGYPAKTFISIYLTMMTSHEP